MTEVRKSPFRRTAGDQSAKVGLRTALLRSLMRESKFSYALGAESRGSSWDTTQDGWALPCVIRPPTQRVVGLDVGQAGSDTLSWRASSSRDMSSTPDEVAAPVRHTLDVLLGGTRFGTAATASAPRGAV